MKPENYWGPLAYIEKYNLKISGIIHIGAHFAGEVEHYMVHNIKNIVFFEPLSRNYSILLENTKNLDANIRTHQVALGNKNGIEHINVSTNNTGSSSILKPKQHLELHPEVSFDEVEQVLMHKLDDYNYKKYNLLVVDVQGYELEVFKGSKNTLQYIDYIYCEVNRGEMYENNTMINDLDDFLSLYNFSRVETEWWAGNGLWGDALYIKNY